MDKKDKKYFPAPELWEMIDENMPVSANILLVYLISAYRNNKIIHHTHLFLARKFGYKNASTLYKAKQWLESHNLIFIRYVTCRYKKPDSDSKTSRKIIEYSLNLSELKKYGIDPSFEKWWVGEENLRKFAQTNNEKIIGKEEGNHRERRGKEEGNHRVIRPINYTNTLNFELDTKNTLNILKSSPITNLDSKVSKADDTTNQNDNSITNTLIEDLPSDVNSREIMKHISDDFSRRFPNIVYTPDKEKELEKFNTDLHLSNKSPDFIEDELLYSDYDYEEEE